MPLEPTLAEERLLATFARGAIADYSEAPLEERRLRAEFLWAALSERTERGALEGDPSSAWPSFRGALRIRGAHVVGVLRVPISEGVLASGRASLWFSACRFEDPVDLSGAELLSVRLLDCELPAFIGASLRLKADLDLSGSHLCGIADPPSDLGEVGACSVYLNGAEIGGRLLLGARGVRRFEAFRTLRLEGARIEGDLVLDGARLDGCGSAALDAHGASIGGDVNLCPIAGESFESHGEVSLCAATIRGDLRAPAALLIHPVGRALHCEDLQVESVSLTSRDGVPFRAVGRINFLSAVVGGNFILTHARVAPGPDYEGRSARGGQICINLQQVRISNALLVSDVGALDPDKPRLETLSERRPVEGWFLLTAAHVRSILDEEDGWPAPGYLELEGLTYDRIFDAGGGDQAARRLRWLRLQYPRGIPTANTFRPQPFEALAQVLRQHGRGEEADEIAVEKIRMRLAATVDGPFARLMPSVLMMVSRHGHSSARAVLSFVLYVALGTLLYGAALWSFDQPFVPIETDPVVTEYTAAFGLLHTQHAEGCPPLVIPFFALDTVLPVVDIGQSSTCRFDPRGRMRWLWLSLHATYTVLGAVLSAIVVLTLSGLLRRD